MFIGRLRAKHLYLTLLTERENTMCVNNLKSNLSAKYFSCQEMCLSNNTLLNKDGFLYAVMHFIYSCIQNDSTNPETAVLYIYKFF